MCSLNEGKYIYCIIATNEAKTFGPLGIGARGDELYTVCLDNISAVVSNSPIVSYSISRENTIAHERAIEEVMKTYTVLPVRFGTITEDEENVREILKREYDKFKELLNKMEGKKEMGLKAIFEDSIYNDILERYPEIRALKEKIKAFPQEQTIYQRVEIGGMVQVALEKEKQIYNQLILNILNPLAEEVKINNNYGERMILNAAFLVYKDKEEMFDQEVRELDNDFGDKINFKYIGTVPPFNFVNLVIETKKY
jgi:hypothetical protein